jgi:hypothetical protein
MINKVATTHCSFLRLQIKREDISTNAMSVTKTEVYRILRDVCIVSRDVCIVSNRLTCIDSKLSEMEILAQPLSLPFIIENLNTSPTACSDIAILVALSFVWTFKETTRGSFNLTYQQNIKCYIKFQ